MPSKNFLPTMEEQKKQPIYKNNREKNIAFAERIISLMFSNFLIVAKNFWANSDNREFFCQTIYKKYTDSLQECAKNFPEQAQKIYKLWINWPDIIHDFTKNPIQGMLSWQKMFSEFAEIFKDHSEGKGNSLFNGKLQEGNDIIYSSLLETIERYEKKIKNKGLHFAKDNNKYGKNTNSEEKNSKTAEYHFNLKESLENNMNYWKKFSPFGLDLNSLNNNFSFQETFNKGVEMFNNGMNTFSKEIQHKFNEFQQQINSFSTYNPFSSNAFTTNDLLKPRTLSSKEMALLRFFYDNIHAAKTPNNFPLLNDEFWREMIITEGESIKNGLNNYLEDIKKWQESGEFRILTTPENKFIPGKNIAITPGKVVFRNEMFELLQYEPTTEKVYKNPILICPAWINKYYVLDLEESNSLVKWLVSQGNTVFVISWNNPGPDNCKQNFDDYIQKGTVIALEMILMICGGDAKVNCVSYCLGGTVMAMTAAYLKSQSIDYISSIVFLASLVDFSECGIIGAFIHENIIDAIDQHIDEVGFLSGNSMFSTFAMIRPKDMLWYYVVNNYLLGKEPRPLSVLHWNADSTNMGGPVHKYYLRNLYLNNQLIEGKIKIRDITINLQDIDLPVYMVATKDDHIAPWKSTYNGLQKAYKLSKNKRFILGESGHVMGIINAPSPKRKYGYYVVDEKSSAKEWNNDVKNENFEKISLLKKDIILENILTPEEWLECSQKIDASWWEDMQRWLKDLYLGEEMVKARATYTIDNHFGEAAPGTYIFK